VARFVLNAMAKLCIEFGHQVVAPTTISNVNVQNVVILGG
jgi:hypothetical protein